jgi:predicted nucleotidyltransferase
MVEDVYKAINEFRDNLLLKDGKKIEAIILYGSVVNGRYHPKDSDIDIMVLAKERSIDEDVLDLETAISLKYGVVISALVVTRKEWQEAKSAGYLFPDEVLKGKVIYERGKRRNKISS